MPGMSMPGSGMNPYMTGFPGAGMMNQGPMAGMQPAQPQMNMGMPYMNMPPNMNNFATAMPGGMAPNLGMGMGMPSMGQFGTNAGGYGTSAPS